MTNIAKSLAAKFQPAHRYSNFGHALRQLHVKGFRGVVDLELEIGFPITALTGLNGSGKTTLAQIASCAYKAPSTAVGYKRYYVKDFFPVSIVDPSPFAADASIRYRYETTDPSAPQDVTVSRTASEWSGYKRQPERFCYYVGFTLYIPKVERRDLSIYRSQGLVLRAKRPVSDDARRHVAAILNLPYNEVAFQSVGHGTKEAELGMLTKLGASYSENNMGFGEGRILYMIDLLESAPEQSLFILEEPETSLHEDAQRRLGDYLLDVVSRRRHQVLLSTHSAPLLQALPAPARTLLHRDASGVSSIGGLSVSQVRGLLSDGAAKSLTVCVEDEFAKTLLTEIIRRGDIALLKAIRIAALGSTDAVRSGVSYLNKSGNKAIGIRDGDIGESPMDGLYSLPGTRPPELEVFHNSSVRKAISQRYAFDCDSLLSSRTPENHHDLPGLIAAEASVSSDTIVSTACHAFAHSLQDTEVARIAGVIRTALPA
jgi:predicted ATPase